MTSDEKSYTACIGDRMRRRRWHLMWNISDVLEPIPVNMLPAIAKALELKKVASL